MEQQSEDFILKIDSIQQYRAALNPIATCKISKKEATRKANRPSKAKAKRK
jgi:hypothetical protein